MNRHALGSVAALVVVLSHGCAKPTEPAPASTTPDTAKAPTAPPQPLPNAVTIKALSTPSTAIIPGVKTAADVPASEAAWAEYLLTHVTANMTVADVTKLIGAKSYDSGRFSLGGRINSDGMPDLAFVFMMAPHFDIGDWIKGTDGWLDGYRWWFF